MELIDTVANGVASFDRAASLFSTIPYSLFPVPCSLFPVPDSRFPIPDSLLPKTLKNYFTYCYGSIILFISYFLHYNPWIR
ncbi:MAG: hypothetical protein F6K56_11455 [Moorea sp. SIO3G5]|nr:hypothetical protein [Moorena sp. SIO3G5]